MRAVRIEQPGRGGALRSVWAGSHGRGLRLHGRGPVHRPERVAAAGRALLSGHSEVAIGTRLARAARVIRRPKREIISRCYNLLLHASLGTRFSDAQCGLKAIRADAARALLPLTTDTGWFFDTELLVLAERAGLRIHEVRWTGSMTRFAGQNVATALGDLRGIVRLGRGLARGTIRVPGLRSAGFQQAATARPPAQRPAGQFRPDRGGRAAAYLLLYLLLRTVVAAQAANAVSLLLTAVANTAVNRRVTFGIQGRAHAARHQVRGLIAFAIGLALTSGALAALHSSAPRPAGPPSSPCWWRPTSRPRWCASACSAAGSSTSPRPAPADTAGRGVGEAAQGRAAAVHGHLAAVPGDRAMGCAAARAGRRRGGAGGSRFRGEK